MSPAPLTSEAFAAAVLRVAKYRGRPVVVKLGGSAMEDPAATEAALRSVAVLHLLGVQLVLVHGGGKPIDRAMTVAGLTPRKVAGRRYTDDATLAIVVRVLKDEIGTDLERRLNDLGVESAAVSDLLDGDWLSLPDDSGKPIDLGRVGTVAKVDLAGLRAFFEYRELPVIPSLARAADGGWLNLNADDAAAAVAGALKADRAIFLTDTPGVLRDRRDPASLIPKLSAAECRDLIASGVIDGGMIPKVEACFAAHDAGVPSALILDGRVPYSLLDVFLHDSFTGTEITR
ncbi:MAG: acetylglutamate kinase [Gemmataceae bacterium]|nr:acetylglutamate kinase [Gemmataceae bacterium]